MTRRAAARAGTLVLWSSQATLLYHVLSPFSEPLALGATFLYGAYCGRRASKNANLSL